MNQVTFEFDPQQAQAQDSTGFELGWDHAHHGLVPPAELLLEGTPIGQGWRAAKAVFGHRTLASSRAVRQWLTLRTQAWRRGLAFETTQVTAHYLTQIEASHCPVTRQPLVGVPGSPDAAVVTRLQPDAGYAAGHLAVVSQRAADGRGALDARGTVDARGNMDARGTLDAREVLREAARIDAECWRLAVLASFVTALPFSEAARVPLRVLPPNRVRLLNGVQGLQALLTLQFSTPGWSARVRAIAKLLPQAGGAAELRQDFNLFVGALVPRLLEAGAGHDSRATRRALEDAWADERLNRRWQQFVMSLGEAGVESLLQRAAGSDAAGLAGVHTLMHATAAATEGWSLASRGRLLSPPRRAPARPADHQRTTVRPAAPASRA
jgi:hypothetical protein